MLTKQLEAEFRQKEAALMLCDMQNDYLKPPHGDYEKGKPVIDNAVKLLEKARTLELPVIYTRRVYRKDGAHRSRTYKLKNIVSYYKAPITVEGTWGVEVIDELRPLSTDIVVDKIRYSGFFSTALETILRARGITYLLMAGGTTNWGVEAGARDAEARDFVPIVISDATFGDTEELHKASLANIDLFIGFAINMAQALGLMSHQ